MVISGSEYLLTVIMFCKLVDSPIRQGLSHLVQIDIMVELKLLNCVGAQKDHTFRVITSVICSISYGLDKWRNRCGRATETA